MPENQTNNLPITYSGYSIIVLETFSSLSQLGQEKLLLISIYYMRRSSEISTTENYLISLLFVALIMQTSNIITSSWKPLLYLTPQVIFSHKNAAKGGNEIGKWVYFSAQMMPKATGAKYMK